MGVFAEFERAMIQEKRPRAGTETTTIFSKTGFVPRLTGPAVSAEGLPLCKCNLIATITKIRSAAFYTPKKSTFWR